MKKKEKISFAASLRSRQENSFTAGTEQTNQLIEVARLVREEISRRNVDYKTTPLESLDPVVKNLIDFLDRAESSLPFFTTPSHRALFEKFRVEARSRMTSKTITYRWLLIFSYRVSFLSSSFHFRNFTAEKDLKEGAWKTHEKAEKFLETRFFFRSIFRITNLNTTILLPFTEDLGIYNMNRLVANGVAPIGQASKKVRVDGMSFSPFSFWDHDLGHVSSIYANNSEYKDFAKTFLKSAETLPPNIRKKVEFYFFYFTHESGVLTGIDRDIFESVNGLIQEIKNNRRTSYFVFAAEDVRHFGLNLFDAGVDIRNEKAVDQWLLEGANDFLALLRQSL